MKTQNNKTVKRLKLTKETLAVLNKKQQWKIIGGNAGDIKGGEGSRSSQIGG